MVSQQKNSAISFDGFAVLFLFANKKKKIALTYIKIFKPIQKNKFTNFLHRVIFKSNNSRTKNRW
jgi:hypothetical protein